MVGADGEVGRRRPRLDLLVRAIEDWESILSGGMELDDRLLARLETMIEAMDQASLGGIPQIVQAEPVADNVRGLAPTLQDGLPK